MADTKAGRDEEFMKRLDRTPPKGTDPTEDPNGFTGYDDGEAPPAPPAPPGDGGETTVTDSEQDCEHAGKVILDTETYTDEEGTELCSLCHQPIEAGESCGHMGLLIGAGVLALVLIGTVVLLAIRCGNLSKALRRRRRKMADAGAVTEEVSAASQEAPLQAPVQIQVGKLHQLGDRESQQDCLAVSPEALYGSKGVLAIVADGMGGLADGDKVSQTVASTMMNGFMTSREASPELILALTAEANQAVNRFLGPNLGRSGSTLVAGIVRDGLFSYVSVGDSRICLYRQGLLTQLNREHIYRNELRTNAVNGLGTLWDAGTHPKAAGLTSYLGMGELKYVDIPAEPLRVCADDKIILMSDGVYNAMTLPELEAALALPAQQAADTIAATIHSKAFRHQDNYTAVILQF